MSAATSSPTPGVIHAGSRRKAVFRRRIVPWLFVMPILVLNLAVVLGPALSAHYYSLTDWNGIRPPTFIGFENFRTLATESLAERVHNPGLEAARADVIVGGLCVLVSVFRCLDLRECLVSESDILDGLVRSQL